MSSASGFTFYITLAFHCHWRLDPCLTKQEVPQLALNNSVSPSKKYRQSKRNWHLQRLAKVGAPVLVNFITAVAFHSCPSLPAAFTQSGASALANLYTKQITWCSVEDSFKCLIALLPFQIYRPKVRFYRCKSPPPLTLHLHVPSSPFRIENRRQQALRQSTHSDILLSSFYDVNWGAVWIENHRSHLNMI